MCNAHEVLVALLVPHAAQGIALVGGRLELWLEGSYLFELEDALWDLLSHLCVDYYYYRLMGRAYKAIFKTLLLH